MVSREYVSNHNGNLDAHIVYEMIVRYTGKYSNIRQYLPSKFIKLGLKVIIILALIVFYMHQLFGSLNLYMAYMALNQWIKHLQLMIILFFEDVDTD